MSERPHPEDGSLKPGLRTMWKLLRPEDWEWTAPNSLWNDEVRHKRLDIWFYLDNNGIRYRDSRHNVLYEPGFFAFELLAFKVAEIRRRLGNKRNPEAAQPIKLKRPRILPRTWTAKPSVSGANRPDPSPPHPPSPERTER